MNKPKLLERIKQLIQLAEPTNVAGEGGPPLQFSELLTGALTLLNSIYGQDSLQVRQLLDFRDVEAKYGRDLGLTERLKAQRVKGALKAAHTDLEADLLGNVERRITGEVLSDFITLARLTLEDGSESAKNVAAVLAAAVYEDTIRRMGAKFCGINNRIGLAEILQKLQGTIIHGSQVGISQSYLGFRNNALHAEWTKIDRPEVKSILAFVEELLFKHFE